MKKYREEDLEEDFYSDRPIGIGSSLVREEWGKIKNIRDRMIDDGEDIFDLSIEELKRIVRDAE